ncbi:uncharacterized protein LOC122986657 [Thunnus albacares]|uniref:uncharacterized protein LOC122986657 n=1 Tax=Thunnus albacares TaxID=8236 RepID=UPI001CF6C55F|nr:uncharacterized protein LOC122986657 [Thunnus albacares]
MSSFSLLGLYVLSFTLTAAGLQSSDGQLVMFALLADNVILPCGIPSIKSCSSTNWNMIGEFRSVTEVVKEGKVTRPNAHRLILLRDCSLQINHLVNNDARLYTCESGSFNSSVSLKILKLIENPTPEEDKIELHCFLDTYKGHIPLNDKDIHIKWSAEDNTPISGNRFHIENPSNSFSKLIISKKTTDHHRKWKCQVTQNDEVKATISYTTTVKDGIEEVFAAVGESVSFTCTNTSSLGVDGRVEWAVGERPLTADTSPEKGQIKAFHVNKDSSLFISEVSALYSGVYQCSVSTGEQTVLNKIKLHTLDVTSKYGPGGDNLTLTCVLTCAQKCENDFNLTWCGSSQNGLQSSLMNVSNTLISTLFLPVLPVRSVEIACCVHREGAVMLSKTWRPVNPLQTPAWFALPLGLLMCAAAGGLYMYMKRKHNKDAGAEPSSIEMTHVYESIQDENNEELLPPRQPRREAPNNTDSFYDLLQAVN